jgi:hypothetical protein
MDRVTRARTRIFNETIAQVRQVAFLADLAQQIVSGGGRQRFSGVQHPDAMLILERPHATGRAQHDLLTAAFQFQRVARFQLQFLAQRFGDDDAACFVHNEAGIHIGIIIWVHPLINAILRSFQTGFAWGHFPSKRAGIVRIRRWGVERILVSGASGPIGKALLASFASQLERQDTQIVRLVRGRARDAAQIAWDPLAPMSPAVVSGFDAVVHLAGENLAGRWTAEKKKQIRDSRVLGTRNLAAALARTAIKPRVLLCASAVGFYGNRDDEVLREESAAGQGFLAEVCREWEDASRSAAEAGIRTVNLRIGLVLSAQGGALGKMLTPFRLGLGGRMGPGRQWWSWIHVNDIVSGIQHAMRNQEISGPVNLVAPNPVRNAEFTQALASVLRRPAIFPMPEFVLRLAFGKQAAEELLLASQRVEPGKLLASGYKFRFCELRTALEDLVG